MVEQELRPIDDKARAALEKLEQGFETLIESQNFKDYLDAMSRFHSYSFNNTMLIMMQKQDATLVAGYRKWQELKRQVRKGEKGITIITPVLKGVWTEDEETGERKRTDVLVGFGTGTVFDVAQTDGEPLPSAPVPKLLEGSTDRGKLVYDGLGHYVTSQGVSVIRPPLADANGYWQWSTKTIAVSRFLEGDQATKTMAHETAHFVADDRGLGLRDEREVTAEGSAYVFLQHYGIDSSEYSFPYMAHWAKDKGVLPRRLGMIQKVSHTMIENVDAILVKQPGDQPAEPRIFPVASLS